jgi:anti-sigma regulatory factor (Ser/Thr protein kinase)
MVAPEYRFTNRPNAPRNARAWMAQCLHGVFPRGHPALDEVFLDALIVVSELVTNAVRCGATQGRLTYRLEDGYLEVAVTDNGTGWPQLRDAGPTDTHGRGLLVVTQLSSSVGADPVAGGKQVWARLAVPSDLTAGCRR